MGLVQFIGFEAFTMFGFFVLSNLEKLLQYFVLRSKCLF